MKTPRHSGITRQRAGFTLVEIMIVVSIIGLLATISVPAFVRARKRAQVTSTVNDLRVFAQAISMYRLEAGEPPANAWPRTEFPPGLDGYIPQEDWDRGAHISRNSSGAPPGTSHNCTLAASTVKRDYRSRKIRAADL